jgi:hypothetical protein
VRFRGGPASAQSPLARLSSTEMASGRLSLTRGPIGWRTDPEGDCGGTQRPRYRRGAGTSGRRAGRLPSACHLSGISTEPHHR